jgi:hypothetical protein
MPDARLGSVELSRQQVDEFCETKLRRSGFLPGKPGPVDIEKFVESQYGSILDYGDLPVGILGMTIFHDGIAERILISFALGMTDTKVAQRRERATIAHEIGHVMFHADEARSVQCLCREEDVEAENVLDRWAETQANWAIGGLLLPTSLVRQLVAPYEKWFRHAHLRRRMRLRLAWTLATTFEVNVSAARVRLKQLYPQLNFRDEAPRETQLDLLS